MGNALTSTSNKDPKPPKALQKAESLTFAAGSGCGCLQHFSKPVLETLQFVRQDKLWPSSWYLMDHGNEWWMLIKMIDLSECFMVDNDKYMNVLYKKNWCASTTQQKKPTLYTMAPWLPGSSSSYPQKPFIKTSFPCWSRNLQQNHPQLRSEPPSPKRT